METIGTILMLVAMVGFLLGVLGVIKGNVKFLKLRNRKASALFIVLSFVVFLVGGFMLPTSPTAEPVDKQVASTVEQKKDESEKEQEPAKEQETKEVAISEIKTLNGELEVHFVDVGQGAAQVIITPNKKVMVIDGGNNDDEDDMVAYLNQLGVSKIDILVGTHPDADHIGGIDAVIDSFEIGKIYMPKVQRNTDTFESVLTSIQNKGLSVTTAKAGIELELDPTLETKMISPITTDDDANEMSAVIRLQYGEKSFLLTGDAGISTEKQWIESGVELQADVLLVGHHGSEHSTSEEFVKVVKPEYAVIQVGKNSYGHPTSEVLDRLHNHSVKIYRNDTDGTIVFKTNGKEINVDKKEWSYVSATPKTQTPSATPQTTTPTTESKSSNGTSSLTATSTIDNASPNQNEEVTVTVTVKDQNGKPVSGANVHLNLVFKSKDTPYDATTGANGVATLSFKIGRAAAGFTVNGDIAVSANGVTTTTQTAFTPR